MLPSNLPEPPANCEALNQFVSHDLCSYSFECGATPFYSRCELGDNDTWACFCATSPAGTVVKELMFHGADGATVCGSMARACWTGAPAGERVCARTNELFSASECAIDESCGPTFDLGSGVKASGVERHSVTCTPGNAGTFSCVCQPERLGKQEHTLTAPSLQGACEAMIGVCRDRGGISAAVPTCKDTVEMLEGDGCGLHRTCTRSAGLGNNVSLTSSMTRLAVCSVMVGEPSYCNCSGDSLADFDLLAEFGTGTSPCRTMLDACMGATPLQPIGPIDCKISKKSEQAQACTTNLTCTRQLNVGAVEATGWGKLALGCQQHDPGGSWWCACGSQGAPKLFELGSAPSAESACDQAIDRCLQQVEVDFGPHAPLEPLPTPF